MILHSIITLYKPLYYENPTRAHTNKQHTVYKATGCVCQLLVHAFQATLN